MAAGKILDGIDQETVFSSDTFFEEYRKKRLLEMQQAAGLKSAVVAQQSTEPLGRLRGRYDEITDQEYLAVTGEEADEDEDQARQLVGYRMFENVS